MTYIVLKAPLNSNQPTNQPCEVDCITVLGFLHSEFQIVYYFTSCKFASSALILLVWQQKEHLPYRKSILSQQLPGVCLRTFG